jgi:hypothetical protein
VKTIVASAVESDDYVTHSIQKWGVMRVVGVDKRSRKDLVLSWKRIPWTSSYRYPGVILCDDLSMMPYVNVAIAKVSKTAGIFKHLSSSFGAFPLGERVQV